MHNSASDVPVYFLELLTKLFALYPGAASSISSATAAAWWEHLKRFPPAELASAFRRAPEAAGGKWVPSAQLIAEIASGKADKSPAEVWGQVIKQIAACGGRKKPAFDPATDAVIAACGGWSRLCASSTQDLHSWIKREFEDHYATRQRLDQQAQISALAAHPRLAP